MFPNGAGGKGGGVSRKGGALLQKNEFQTGSLLERGVSSEVGFNRDFTVKQ